MDIYPLHRCPESTVDAVLNTLTLYKLVRQASEEQFSVLMHHSQLLDLGGGEIVVEEGQIDTWLYFLVKGGLAVYAGERSLKRVNAITPGEVFGDMAVLLHHPRSATVIADTRYRRSIVLRTDFSIFGEPENLTVVSLQTKLPFYRTMVHNLRWKLEVYRTQFPDHAFAADHRKVKLYTGSRDSLEELISLAAQAQRLAELLMTWNLALTGEGLDEDLL